MDLDKAIEYTNERLGSLCVDSSYSEIQNEIIREGIEYLTFVKEILINKKERDGIDTIQYTEVGATSLNNNNL